jgi:glycerol-3-phosphate dehydrogenase
VIFAIPWGNRVVLGTTDTDFDGDFDDVFCSAQDVRYLLEIANHYFPGSQLKPDDVLGTWAGLRPLVCPEEEGLGASQVSREHMVQVDDDGLITVAGGKLTTYRLMADEVVREVARQLKDEGFVVGGCPTGSVMLPGGEGITWRGDELITIGPDGRAAELELEKRLGKDVAEHLQESYGGCWQDVVARITAEPALGRRIIDDLPYLWAEVDYSVEGELVMTLRDFMRRRTQLEIRDAVGSWRVAPDVAQRIGALLGWTAAEIQDEVAAYRTDSGRTMAWRDDI